MGQNPRGNDHSRRSADADNCPALTGNAIQRARLADGDAAEFAMLVRDEPAAVIWGRVARWAAEHPQRFQAAFVHLAAMVDVDAPPATWTRDIGGTTALHPDYRRPREAAAIVPRVRRGPELEAEVVRLARVEQLSDDEICARLGLPLYYVTNARRAARVLRKVGHEQPSVRDQEVARLDALKYPTDQIARQLGVTDRTVMRARQRNATRAAQAAEQRAAPTENGAAA